MKLSLVSKYRNVLLGCAMLWIMLSHSILSFEFPFFEWFKNIGSGGADICLFASGLGCYFSLEKDNDIIRFIKRRIGRLFPTYLCFIIVWIFIKVISGNMTFQAIVGNILGVQSFISWRGDPFNCEKLFNWYIGALGLCYVLAPYFKNIVEMTNRLGKHIFIIMLLIVFSIPFWNEYQLIIIVTRLPIFYIGMMFGKEIKRDTLLDKKDIYFLLFISIMGFVILSLCYKLLPNFLWSHGLQWYSFILIVPGMCVIISLISSFFESNKISVWINNIIAFIGKNSFEIFLVHIPIFNWLNSFIDKKNILILSFALVAAGCFVLKLCAKSIRRVFI